MRVRAYRNLNAPKAIGVEWSVVPLDSVDPDLRRKVCFYASSLDLKEVKFHCQAGGAAKIRDKGVRSVVAWIEGELVAVDVTRTRLLNEPPILPRASNSEGQRVWFKVFAGFDTFTDALDNPIYRAASATLTQSGRCFIV